VSRPGTIHQRRYDGESYPEGFYPDEDYYPDYPEDNEEHSQKRQRKRSVDAWLDQESTLFHGIKRQKIALWLLRLPAFVPWFFILRGWLSLNAKEVLTNTEADVLGTGGELCFLICVSITPLITVTGQRFFTPLRRWYGVMFALIGVSDATTAAITTDFNGGVFGRLAGHTFLVTGFLVVLLAVPVTVTSNTRLQKALGKYWKKVQKVTYVIWGFIILHLALLDGFRPFDGPQGDGDPVFHQRLYQILAVSLPLVVLRLPPVKRWVTEQRAAGQQWKVWVAIMPMAVLYVIAMAFIINEELFTGYKVITMTPPSN